MESMLSSITPYHKGSIKAATIAVSLFIRAVNTRGFLTLSVLYRIRPPNQESANTVTTIVPEVSVMRRERKQLTIKMTIVKKTCSPEITLGNIFSIHQFLKSLVL